MEHRISLYSIVLLTFLFFFSSLSEVVGQPKKSSDAFVHAVSMAYFSPYIIKDDSPGLSMQGLKVGFEHKLNSGRQSRTNARGQVRRAKKEYLFAGNLAYYGRKDYHHGIMLNVETGARYILGPGIVVEGFVGVGVMKRIVEERPKGNFFTEDFGVAPLAAVGIGLDFKSIADVPVYMLLKGGALGMYPTELEVIMPTMEISITYLFNHLQY